MEGLIEWMQGLLISHRTRNAFRGECGVTEGGMRFGKMGESQNAECVSGRGGSRRTRDALEWRGETTERGCGIFGRRRNN